MTRRRSGGVLELAMTMATERSVQSVVVVDCEPTSGGAGEGLGKGEHKIVQAGGAWGVNPSERKLRVINLTAVLVPVIGLAAAIGLLWGVAFDWVQLAIMGVMYLVTAIGITVGFHRMATHKSFETPRAVRYLLAVAGSMAAQGPVIRWCSEHRRHHQHSDTEEDPHSPHMGINGSWGEGVWATVKGAYHAHVGWLLRDPADGLEKYSTDLRRDPALVAANNQFPWLVLLGLIIPAVLGGVVTLSWSGALLGFLWGGLVRVLMVHHITWSVNSVCHLWGSKPFVSHDESRNNAVVGILAMGEGWHNNHHAFPTSARHGLRWWEIDMSYVFIRTLGVLGLARNIRVPNAERIQSKKSA